MAKQEQFDLIVRAKDEASATLGNITRNVVGMVAAFATISAVKTFLQDSVKAAMEAEAAYNDLGASVERRGGDWDRMRNAMEDNLQSMMLNLGLSDESLARSAQVFIDYGADVHGALRLVGAAADLAAGKCIALETATEMLAKASAGNTTIFSRYGFQLDKTKGAATALNQVLGWIEEKWGDAAQAKLQTAEGQLKLLNVQYGQLKTNVGGLVIGPMTDFLAQMNTLLTVLNALEGGWNKLLYVVRWVGSGGGANVVESFRQWNELMAEAAVAAEELARKARDAWDPAMLLLGIGEPGEMSPLRQEIEAVVQSLRKAKTEFEALDEFGGYKTWKGEGGMPSKYVSEEDASGANERRAKAEMKYLEETAAAYKKYYAMIEGIGMGAVDTMVAQFMEGRVRIKFILNQMLSDFMSMVARMAAAKLFGAIANIFVPGGGAAAAALASGAMSGGTRFDVNAAPKSASAGVTVNFNGPVLAEEDYIVSTIVPALERAVRNHRSNLMVR